jgi:peptidoglycan L-alanyl-D-glutamate endopeptidase CwlK
MLTDKEKGLIDRLVPGFKEKVFAFEALCRDQKGIEIQVYCTIRTLAEQAKLYRQSRSFGEIANKAAMYRAHGYDFLAEALEKVGPQASGPHVTNAGPGESWHNFGQAFDSVPTVNGKADWNPDGAGYKVYGEITDLLGLEWGGKWKGFRDIPHIQMQPGTVRPYDAYSSPKQMRDYLEANGLL